MNEHGGFPGHGENAPLDLSALTEAAAASTVARLVDGTFAAWADAVAAVGYCAHPVRLVGSSLTVDTSTGEILDAYSSTAAPLGVLHRPCGNRRAEVCPSCSRVYARDTFELIRAGLTGGKSVPETVADNPVLFVTLTAPSFGPVHGPRPKAGQPVGGRCRPRSGRGDRLELCAHGRPIGCMRVHGADDPANGSPLCADCYDWSSAVVWQWWAPELWRRTTIALRRAVADRLDVTERGLKRVASVQFAKVAEYQARGLVHFHALIRLDGPDGPGSPAPLDGTALAQLLDNAARTVRFTAPPIDADDTARQLAWGRQLDIRVVRAGNRPDDPEGPLTPEQVAGYLAKYATKDATSIRGDTPREHLTRLALTCRTLAARAVGCDEETPYRLLGKWAHMLGFRGHFSTKSRRYSITLGRLRRARYRYQQKVAEARRRGEVLETAGLEPSSWPTRRKPPSSLGPGPTKAPAGPTPATKPSPSPRPPVPASTSSGEQRSARRHDNSRIGGRDDE